MRQSAQVQHDGESSNAAAWAPAEDVDQFDRGHPNTNYGGFIARLIEGDNP